MYALVIDGTITKYFSYPKGFTLGDNQYPADIFMKWSVEEKEAIGIYEVVFDDSTQTLKMRNGILILINLLLLLMVLLQLHMVLLLLRLMQILHGRKMMKMLGIYQMTNQLEILKLED
jgi:hypothetical protein